MKAIRSVLVVLVAGLLGIACGTSSSETPCSVDTDCATGKVCVKGACTITPCAGAGDCQAGQTCVDTNHDDAKECTAVDCAKDADCAAKAEASGDEMTCVQGACVPKEAPLPGDDVVDDATSTADTTGKDTTPPVGTGSLCQACAGDGDCGDSGRCTQLAEGSFCTTECASNDDCPSGFLCFQVTSQGKDCVPGLYTKCPQCLIDGCPADQTCDQTSGTCKAAAGECGPCEKDDDCGLGYRCFAFSAEVQRCVPECGAGCPGNSACAAITAGEGTEGVRVCKPNSATCCFGDDCNAGCDCSTNATKPYCNPAGECAECLTDANCPVAKPKCQQGSCQAGASCPAATPIPCGNSNCCECSNDSHCSGAKPYCQANGTCGAEQSCACVAPYPACMNVDGQVVCVECVSDGDCASPACPTCNQADHTCVGADGTCASSGTIPAAECTGCTTDGDCAAVEGLSLKCDAGTGCCYDTTGKCDNTAAFCPEGATCAGLMAIAGLDLGALLGGMGGGSGGIPTDMLGDMASYCSCPPDCLGGQTCVTAKEISDKSLGMLAGILGGMVSPGSGSYCADLNSVPDLLGGLLGGGGLPFP